MSVFIERKYLNLDEYKENILKRVKSQISNTLLVNIDDYMSCSVSLEEDDRRMLVEYNLWFVIGKGRKRVSYLHYIYDGYLVEYLVAEKLAQEFIKGFVEAGFQLLTRYNNDYSI